MPPMEKGDDDALQDVLTRTRQLEVHILRSPEYLFKADQLLKRQSIVLGLTIILLLIFEGLFVALEARALPTWLLVLICVTSALVLSNCLLLIRTKRSLRRLNEFWLNPEEKAALAALREQHERIRTQGHASLRT